MFLFNVLCKAYLLKLVRKKNRKKIREHKWLTGTSYLYFGPVAWGEIRKIYLLEGTGVCKGERRMTKN